MPWISDIQKLKDQSQKIAMVTCYDAIFAKCIAKTDIDILLVGDSIAMTVYGFDSTIHATLDMIAMHTAAVRRGAPKKFIIGDLPFGTFQQGPEVAFNAAKKLMQAGANAVKLEGVSGIEPTIQHLIQCGIPVMGHLGLTPQSVNQQGGYKVQARAEAAQQQLLADARALQDLGVFALVLECIPSALATDITKSLSIPVIGIGAGAGTDGQVLVLPDLLGIDDGFQAKFVKQYAHLAPAITSAVVEYSAAVKAQAFPTQAESYD